MSTDYTSQISEAQSNIASYQDQIAGQQANIADLDDKINALYGIRDQCVQQYESDAQGLFYQTQNYDIPIWQGVVHDSFSPAQDQAKNDVKNGILYKARDVYDAIDAEINDLNHQKNESWGIIGQLGDFIEDCAHNITTWYNDMNYS
jgi:peptidoglycan hydrolase CwlO-like protein